VSDFEEGLPAENPEPGADSPNKAKAKGGRFFSIDKRTWGRIAGLGDINAMCAYLVLARGVDQKFGSSGWSKKSLKDRLGLGWENARNAIQALRSADIIRDGDGSTAGRPRYELVPFSKITQTNSQLESIDCHVLNQLRIGVQPRGKRERTAAKLLANRGLLTESIEGRTYFYALLPQVMDGLEHRIWMPNTLVDGAKKGEIAPLRCLRQTGDVWALRTLVDLYGAHNLPDYGGINRATVNGKFSRSKVGEQGRYIVWAFCADGRTAYGYDPIDSHWKRPGMGDQKRRPGQQSPVWETLYLLERLGLISFVPYLFENDTDKAEPIHSFGIGGDAEAPIEREIYTAAHSASMAICLYERIQEVPQGAIFCPVMNSIPNPQLISVLRLTFRPWTKRTGAWYAALNSDGRNLVEHYKRIAQKANEVATRSNLRTVARIEQQPHEARANGDLLKTGTSWF
jgi:hypothetical protein